MPALPFVISSLLESARAEPSSLPSLENAASKPLQVVCAWPISGQYGPGSRVLYYILIVTCIIARKRDWLVRPCLAIALLPPAIAAVHGIVLAAVHVDGAVDMDIFGAFQLCSIGILAAPVTVMVSRTLSNDRPIRNLIILWTLLILSGLLSLTVEFYRTETHDCLYNNNHDKNAISSDPTKFPYKESPNCGLLCSPSHGPFSSTRGGAADNVYVIPAPTILTFPTTTLLAAGCSLHTILCIILMWTKTLEANWRRLWGREKVVEPDRPIQGTKITEGFLQLINKRTGGFLAVVATLVFGGAGIAILVVGELNFFSEQVDYETEPMANVGQWGPIAGAGIAIFGSAYVVIEAERYTTSSEPESHQLSHLPQDSANTSTPNSLQQHQTRSSTTGGVQTLPAAASNSSAGRDKVAKFLGKINSILGDPSEDFVQDEAQKPPIKYPNTPLEDLMGGAPREVRNTGGTDLEAGRSRAGTLSASIRSLSRGRSPLRSPSDTQPAATLQPISPAHLLARPGMPSNSAGDG